ncbi:MAG TPA: hypothetical protein VGQ62_19465, partial [Chloroflexota bacterium]|nr:hypothetical protein [Chloroflexota bacterium]
MRRHASSPSLGARLRSLGIPLAVGLLAAYVIIHSPARRLAASVLGRTTGACYFCQSWVPPLDVLNSLSALALLVLVVLGAWSIAAIFDGVDYERPLVFSLTALALLSVPASIIGGLAALVGVPLLRPPLGPLLSALPATLVVIAACRRGWRPHLRNPHIPRSPIVRLTLLLACGLLLSSALVGALHPPTGWDPLSYHAPVAVFFWRDGDLSSFLGRAPDYAAWAHPGTAELFFGSLRLVGGERLANLGQLPFAIAGAFAVAAFARRLGLRTAAAILAGSLFLLAPLVVGQIQQQLNDVAAAALLMTTVSLAAAPRPAWTFPRLALLGLALGLMTAMKLVLIPSVVALGLIVIVRAWQRSAHNPRRLLTHLLLVGAVFFIVVAPWWTRN